jgi:hypothetical protein
MTTIDLPTSSLSEAVHHAQLRRAVIASIVGTTIEWYDFLLYSQMTALAFGKLFFPRSAPLVGVMEAFAVYLVGFVARPIGATIFGHFGDRIGRKKTLIATLLMAGLATFAVGIVPTYARIGICGAIFLTIMRFIRGVGIGGEWGGSVLLSMEWARTNAHRGFIASWPQFGLPAGSLLAYLAVLVCSAISGDEFLVWGWRIPFLLSIIMVGVGLYIRLEILETPPFKRLLAEKPDRTVAGARSDQAAPEVGHSDCLREDGRTGARLHLWHVCLYLWDNGSTQLTRTPARCSRHRVGVVVLHDTERRPFVRPYGSQADLHHGLYRHRGVRFRLFHDTEYRDARLDVPRDRDVLRSSRSDVRSAGGADSGMFPGPVAL